MSLYAADGSINVIVVDGETLTGLSSPSGAWYVVDATTEATPGTGQYHPSGALRVSVADGTNGVGRYAKDGSVLVSEDGSYNAQRITVVSGSLGGSGGSDALLLETGDFLLLETGDKLLKE